MTWTAQQQAIMQWFRTGTRSLVVSALAGCLSEDTNIGINRGGKSSVVTIARLTRMMNGGVCSGKRFDSRIPTMVRSYGSDGVVKLAEVSSAVYSGRKLVYTVTTADGHAVSATPDHRLLTRDGWSLLRDLAIGSELMVDQGKGWKRSPRTKATYARVAGMDAHPYAHSSAPNKCVWTHRLVVESGLNGLPLNEFVRLVRAGSIDGLTFLDPAEFHVHHRDGDHTNNSPENLEVLTPEAHFALHAKQGCWMNVQARVQSSRVVSIERLGERDTYDLTMADGELPNFLANGVVVHNSGKTTTIVHGIGEADQALSVVLLAFNKRIAVELQERVTHPNADVFTLHALGYKAIRRFWESARVDASGARARDLAQRVVGQQTADAIQRCVAKLHTAGRESYAQSVEELLDLEWRLDLVPDKEWENYGWDAQAVAAAAWKAMELAKDRPLAIDFADMLYLPLVHGWFRPTYDLVVVDEYQDMNLAQHEIVTRIAKGRICVVGDRFQCQPGDTIVSTVDGPVRIDQIRAGDTVTSWDRHSQAFISRSAIAAVARREYEGRLFQIEAGGKVAKCTPNHRWVVRWTSRQNKGNYLTYLMRRGKSYRIGQCKMFRPNGALGPHVRRAQEKGDAFWILGVHDSKLKALGDERVASARFAIPELCFMATNHTELDQETLDTVWSELGDMTPKAEACLSAYGLYLDHPFMSRATPRLGRQTLFEVEACNLLSGHMSVPVAPDVFAGFDKPQRHAAKWAEITVTSSAWKGTVYSLDVAKHHKYVSDGLVTCNCIYGFRGASAKAMDDFKVSMNADELPMTRTYRCGKTIVRAACDLVPQYEAAESNADGEVVNVEKSDLLSTVRVGDAVLSRLNAPLVGYCLKLLRSGVPAKIEGRADIATSLKTLVNKLATGKAKNSLPELLKKLAAWQAREAARLQASRARDVELKAEAICDKADALRSMIDGASGVPEVLARISEVFKEISIGRCVTFSTVHKAKGLEWDRVFLLSETFRSRRPGQPLSQEEKNIKYVAITRAKSTLAWVVEDQPKGVDDGAGSRGVGVSVPATGQDADAGRPVLVPAVSEVEGS